jgi:hypothetical protein
MRKLLFTALAAFVLSGCFYVEAEEPSVCKTVPDQSFPGSAVGGTYDVSQDFNYDFGNELVLSFNGKTVDTTAQILSVTLTAKSGITDFSFIDKAQVTLIDPSGANPDVQVLAYTKASGSPQTATLVVDGGDQVDITKYLQGGQITVRIHFNGSAPPGSFTADVKACVYAKVHYQYL